MSVMLEPETVLRFWAKADSPKHTNAITESSFFKVFS
jgi:hypothetical protein